MKATPKFDHYKKEFDNGYEERMSKLFSILTDHNVTKDLSKFNHTIQISDRYQVVFRNSDVLSYFTNVFSKTITDFTVKQCKPFIEHLNGGVKDKLIRNMFIHCYTDIAFAILAEIYNKSQIYFVGNGLDFVVLDNKRTIGKTKIYGLTVTSDLKVRVFGIHRELTSLHMYNDHKYVVKYGVLLTWFKQNHSRYIAPKTRYKAIAKVNRLILEDLLSLEIKQLNTDPYVRDVYPGEKRQYLVTPDLQFEKPNMWPVYDINPNVTPIIRLCNNTDKDFICGLSVVCLEHFHTELVPLTSFFQVSKNYCENIQFLPMPTFSTLCLYTDLIDPVIKVDINTLPIFGTITITFENKEVNVK